MNRVDRFEQLFAERDPRKVCRHIIKLGTGNYRCVRPNEHAGAHDAGVRHDDGFLVRW